MANSHGIEYDEFQYVDDPNYKAMIDDKIQEAANAELQQAIGEQNAQIQQNAIEVMTSNVNQGLAQDHFYDLSDPHPSEKAQFERVKNMQKGNSQTVTVVKGSELKDQLTTDNTKNQVTLDQARPVTELQEQHIDFSQRDFQTIQSLDPNSPVSKMKQSNNPKQINSMWYDKDYVKRYLATKTVFKIKLFESETFKEYRFRSTNDQQLTRMRQMGEDIRNFYQLLILEGNTETDPYDNDKQKRVLIRNGKSYTMKADLEADYYKEIALNTLGNYQDGKWYYITEDEYAALSQWSDPNYTIIDIFGVNDILVSLIDRAINGTSYFRLAFGQS